MEIEDIPGTCVKKITCAQPAQYRYTWPGQDESYICQSCSVGLGAIANALGLHLQMIPVELSDSKCQQILGSSS